MTWVASYSGTDATVAAWSAEHGLGLLHLVDLPPWASWAAAIILFDLWMYVWHVLNHKVPLLWRFHAVHHADRRLDVTSAVRFHTGEIVLSAAARLAVVPLLGLTLEQLLLYELVLQPIILFHHSNVRTHPLLDRVLRWIIPTPRVHWVHHSKVRMETDSNYGSVFSWWDRVFRTFRLRPDAGRIEFGLEISGDHESDDLTGMGIMPFTGRFTSRGTRDGKKEP